MPRTGVIYVVHRAAEAGFSRDAQDWANLGQGAPETGPLPESPKRVETLYSDASVQGYAPVDGEVALRQQVADFYNSCYRQGMASQYSYENVAISGGGRLALTRLAAALGNINMGHFIPDYTAYEELLDIFKAFTSIPILLRRSEGYKISKAALQREIQGRGLGAILASNPCNPTGKLVQGEELRQWVEMARDNRCTFILDEFYSHYVYPEDPQEVGGMVSAAAYVNDVDADPVVLVDGLTKNWRYPGWRVSWTVGPKAVIEAVASAGSFLDGGTSRPLQMAAIPLLDPAYAKAETRAIQKHFRQKRDFALSALKAMGIGVVSEPQGSFYVWADLSGLPEPIQDGMAFFEAGLQEKVITVPGEFFDVNPGHRRTAAMAWHKNFCRISFGPEMRTLEMGMAALGRVIQKYR